MLVGTQTYKSIVQIQIQHKDTVSGNKKKSSAKFITNCKRHRTFQSDQLIMF